MTNPLQPHYLTITFDRTIEIMRLLLIRLAIMAGLAGGLLVVRPAHAWWAPGHAVIARLAYRQMAPQTRTAVDTLLAQHPDYKNWLPELPADLPDTLRGEYVFAIASTWPDRIKDAKDTTVSVKFFNPGDARNPPPQPFPAQPALYPDLFTHENWHYCDIPINGDGQERLAPAIESVLTALPTCRGNVALAVLPASYRAYYLAWIAHLVGDIHQPLHTTERFSAAHPKGDAGGNTVRFPGNPDPNAPRNLHGFWDSLLGPAPDPTHYNRLKGGWGQIDATMEAVTRAEARLLHGFAPAVRDSTDEALWLREGVALAQQFVYTFGDPDQPQAAVPDAEYRRQAQEIAYQRAALAARRLARVCDTALR